MSGVIKSSALAERSLIRPLPSVPTRPLLSAADEERDRMRLHIADVESQLRQRDETIVALRADIARAFEQGMADGRAAGQAEAQDRQSERLAILGTAMRAAQARLADSLASLEPLASLLARECLDIVLGDPKHRATTVRKIIVNQAAKIEKSSVLAIELSDADFPDAAMLAAIAAEVGIPAASLTATAEMPAGGCTMTLRLGRIEVGLDQQWPALRAVLDDMASPRRDE